ncbi:MAG: thiolase domain-containing protein [Melioribacteraceae bacterium]|nr:thiolase domain-containing protein [Melioribacteraceae bacterium]MCF8355986.1 thiolase domain-containing protein [Melioribacteraceae bacterium]MCF8394608.1 thiolase domain-containing protein [Melioribacteraceae bacterium]MCF8419605.1 thiolase domain-containing protein [Melioribacteraceae bacterium]
MRDVAVIGIGMNEKWGELWEKSFRTIFVEAALNAIDDAKIDKIDAMYIGCMSGGLFVGQEHIGSLLADYLGTGPIPATRIESACASGGLAFRQAFIDVASGMSDIVLAGGVEKMLDVDGGATTYALSTAADQEYECFHGITFPGLYAMIANAHMHKYGTTRKQLAQVAVKNHKNGSMNPRNQFPFETDIDSVINSVMIADPLTIMDCSPVTDGAAAVILCPLDLAKEKFKDHPVIQVIGSGHATDSIALHSRKDLTWLSAVELSGKNTYKMADKNPSDIDVCEVHDCFTIAEICATEALGFFEPGKGGMAVQDDVTAIEGKIPINTSGGLKSKGHPVGATGIAQILEITEQLRGDSGKRQVKDAKIGMTQNMGGSGGSSVCHILEVK